MLIKAKAQVTQPNFDAFDFFVMEKYGYVFRVKLNWNKCVTKLYNKIDYSASKQFNTLLLAGNVLRVLFFMKNLLISAERKRKSRESCLLG